MNFAGFPERIRSTAVIWSEAGARGRPVLRSGACSTMLFHEVTDALGVGGLFRDVGRPLDRYLAETERDLGWPVEPGPEASSGSAPQAAPTRRGSVRCAPETVSALVRPAS
ncbi:hypothetical protein [Methylobacterium oryzihabitans]|uniref:Uncharacterized protein n=1 Tax=Methylobacterium oryzihabitans TaxID=2499852 RepID=A0A437NUU8_9HYPH|nr:hypothetical protein [Methylobacterium oryzihabitans]RVU13790.1 hypothetical protein EOE48_26245 [Methylobacterium oryzihabitans]